MDLKASVRHVCNAFPNGVEMNLEVACLVLHLPFLRMKKVLILHTVNPHEKTLLLKNYETLQKIDQDSHDI